MGEVTNRYPLDPSSARYVRFVGFAILVDLLCVIPSILQQFALTLQTNPSLAGWLMIASIVLFVVIIIVVVVRQAILFPAIAIDAPGATWSNARNDTKGSSWRVFLILLCVGAAPVIIMFPLYYFLLSDNSLASSLIDPFVETLSLCAFAAAASHIYRARADRLARAAA
jgi:hypothetical protein